MVENNQKGVAIVTGATGGIGAAVCTELAALGYHVAGIDLRVDHVTDSACETLRACDVTSPVRLAAVIDAIAAEVGTITALVNVAGVASSGSALTVDEHEIDRVHATNVKGTLFACQAVAPHMAANGGGSIVNIGSIVGKNGGNARPWLDATEISRAAGVAYGMSKAAVHAMTFFLAKELAAQKVRVNAVAPGPIATAMTSTYPEALARTIPLGGMGRPEDVAAVVGFLVSDRARFISGEIVDVNGAQWCD